MRTKRFVAVAFVVLTYSPAMVAPAVAKNWNVGTGNWSVPGNWNPAGVPTTGEAVNIVFTDGTARNVTLDVSTPALGLVSIDLTGAGTAASTLSIPSNFNLTAAVLDIGGYDGAAFTNGRGAVSQSAGTTTVSPGGDLILAVGSGSTGTYTLSGGALVANQSEFVALNGAGTFSHSAGTNTINANEFGSFYVGFNSGSLGTYNLSGTGALVSDEAEYIGYSGTGTFNQTGGTNAIANSLHVGTNAGSTGTYNLGGGTLSLANNAIVGNLGTGTFNQTGGALTSNGHVVIGSAGTGIFNQTGGTNTINASLGGGLTIGANPGSTGTYTISGGTLWVGNDIFVGDQGTGTLTIQNNASAYVTDYLIIGGPSSNVNLDGGTLRFNQIIGIPRLNYAAGTIQLAESRNFLTDTTITFLYGANPTIPTGKGLNIEGGANIGDANAFQTVNISGGSLMVGGQLDVLSAYLEISNGGTLTSNFSGIANGVSNLGSQVTVTGPDSTWNVGTDLLVGVSSNGVLDVRDGALVDIGLTLYIDGGGVVNINGGTIRFNGYSRLGIFNFNVGTIQLAGNRSIGSDADITDIFGGAPTLTPGKGLTVEGTATLQTTVTLDGGTFTANALAGGSYLQLYRGTLNLMNQAVTIGSGGPLGSALDVNEDMTVNVTLGITNQGLVTGDGQIGGTFTNSAGGELRAQAGRSLRLTGSGNTNAGQIKLLGGELEFTQNLTNNAGAFISGNGALIVGGGLVNQGTMNFAGTANIDGDVTNAPGGKIISGGGGATIFYDDVINNGEIRTSTNGFTVFFGSVSGAGTFTGTGTVNFEGDLTPGNSPASLSFGGNVVFGPDSTLVLEIGGLTAGSQYDQINVAGTLTLDGTLQISLINGFTPALGDQFNLFSFTSSSGDFANYEGLAVGGHLELNGSFGPGGLQLSARPAVDGDINLDGTVDIFDVNSVSANWGTAGPQGDANGDGIVDIFDVNLISANWGATGSGAAAVPEPTSLFLLSLGGVVCAALRYRRSRCPTIQPPHNASVGLGAT